MDFAARFERFRAVEGPGVLIDLGVGGIDANDVCDGQRVEDAHNGLEQRRRNRVFVVIGQGGRKTNVHSTSDLSNRHSPGVAAAFGSLRVFFAPAVDVFRPRDELHKNVIGWITGEFSLNLKEDDGASIASCADVAAARS